MRSNKRSLGYDIEDVEVPTGNSTKIARTDPDEYMYHLTANEASIEERDIEQIDANTVAA